MKKSTVNVLLFLIIIGSPFWGFAIGLVLGSTADERRMEAEYNTPWKRFESSYRFVEILEATSNIVWARTDDGKLYFYSWDDRCYDGDECLKWVETKEVPDDIHNEDHGELPMRKGETCPELFGSFPKEPPGKVIECAVGPFRTIVGYGTYYVLLEEGTIWFWQTPVPNDSPALTAIYYAFYGLVLGLAVSIIISTISFIVFISNTLKKKARNHQ